MGATQYQFERKRIGELDCGIVRPADSSTRAKAVSVICHGFGAGGDDLVGLAPEILQLAAPTEPVMMVFPAAPLTLDAEGIPGGRAWWKLSIQRLVDAMEAGHYERVREEVPDGIDQARGQLVETIGCILEEQQLAASKLLLGGFSQGAMLSMDVACRGLEQPPAAMTLFSGCLICEREWKPSANRLSHVDIFQSHGTLDPVLPVQTGRWLKDMLVDAGCSVDYVEFEGVHTIPVEAIEKSSQLLSNLLK